MARQGMAATSQPLATATAIRVLQQGGNAVDAAIAANAVLGVVEPMSCGIGGDLFAIVWDAKTKQLYGLNASGRAPAAATIELFKAKGLTAIPTHGPLELVGARLRRRLGPAPQAVRHQALARAARAGDRLCRDRLSRQRDHRRRLARRRAQPRRRSPPRPPATCPAAMRPARARSSATRASPGRSETIAQDGRDAFYRGPLADAIVRYSQSAGGLFALSDFAEHTSKFVDPVSTNYRGYDVWELPPNGQGIAVLQMLNLLEPFDLKSMGPQSAEALHLMIEAKKLAYEDRAKFYADPDFRPPADRDLDLQAVCRPARSRAEPRSGQPEPDPGRTRCRPTRST